MRQVDLAVFIDKALGAVLGKAQQVQRRAAVDALEGVAYQVDKGGPSLVKCARERPFPVVKTTDVQVRLK